MTLLDFLSSASLGGAVAIVLDRVISGILGSIEASKTHEMAFKRGDEKVTFYCGGYSREYTKDLMDAVAEVLEKEGYERVVEEGKKNGR